MRVPANRPADIGIADIFYRKNIFFYLFLYTTMRSTPVSGKVSEGLDACTCSGVFCRHFATSHRVAPACGRYTLMAQGACSALSLPEKEEI